MKPITTKTSVHASAGVTGTKSAAKPKGFSSAWRSFSSVLVMVFSTIAIKASATPITGAALTTTAGSLTATTTCVDGYFCSGWTGTPAKTWNWHVATTGYTSIVFSTPTSSSSTGPHTAQFQWSTDNATWTTFLTKTWTGTGCQTTGSQSLPSACDNQANVYVRAIMTGATASGGTSRMSIEAFSGTASGCTGTPTAGSVSAGSSEFCGSGSTTLTLTGNTAGTTLQWQYSTTSSSGPWTNTGTGTSTLNTGTISTTTYYQVVVSCGVNQATTSPVTLTVHSLPSVGTLSISPANSISNPILVGGTFTASSTVSGGTWSSNNTGVATVNGTTGAGLVNFGGTAVMTYTVVDGTTLCSNTGNVNVYASWPNTLALYAGHDGNSNEIITSSSDVTVNDNMTATGFGSNTACTTGGLSGLTVNTSVTSYAQTNPHVWFKISPASGKALNVFQLQARVRVSGTGPTKARIAYSLDGTNWFADDEISLTSGSCGASANNWFWIHGGGPTITGITGSFYVGIFPYAPGASTGVFQVNTLEVYGQLSSDANCTTLGGSIERGTINASSTTICGGGSRTLELQHHGGVGISYQWEKSTVSALGPWSSTSVADTNVFYTTDSLTDTAWYRVHVTCAGGSDVYSDTLELNVIPAIHDAITHVSPYHVGSTEDFTTVFTNSGATPDSVKWISSYTSTANINTSGVVSNFVFPAKDVRITRLKYVSGCPIATTDTFDIVHDCALAYYLGENGTSTAITVVSPATDGKATGLEKTGFTATTACGNGGLSGMSGVPASFSTSGAHVSFKFTTDNSVNLNVTAISNISATVRSSNSGPQNFRMAYRVYDDANAAWSNWIDEGYDQAITPGDDCGYSMVEANWGGGAGVGDPIPSLTHLLPGVSFDSIEVGVFPFNPSLSTGSFQVNSLTLCGKSAVGCDPLVSGIDESGVPVSTLCPGSSYNLTLETPADQTYWSVWNPNDVTVAYFDVASMTGANTGNISVVSSASGASIYAVGYDATNSCMQWNQAVVDYACPKPTNVANTSNKNVVTFYPNPATSVLNVVAGKSVNVTISGIDGKVLINQQHAKNIDVSGLANGMYIIKAYDDKNLIKTQKFVKD